MVYTIVVHMHAKPDYVPLLHAELNEAYRIHSQDCETISWLIMQPLYDLRILLRYNGTRGRVVSNII